MGWVLVTSVEACFAISERLARVRLAFLPIAVITAPRLSQTRLADFFAVNRLSQTAHRSIDSCPHNHSVDALTKNLGSATCTPAAHTTAL
jgi:hypothetical protein